MSDLDQALSGQQTGDEDAQLDALLAAADAAVLGRLADAVDIDAGRAAVFAPSVTAEEVPSSGAGDVSGLEWMLPLGEDSLLQWLAISGPGYLPRRLDKSTSTIRTMTVVGRALLPHSMRAYWGLATDFLTASNDHLMRLKAGLANSPGKRPSPPTTPLTPASGSSSARCAKPHRPRPIRIPAVSSNG
ncbi:hypothetical protein SSPO_000990 [Streptomyces antimycoticus]|uniref:Uncharacterized protein n=1 Tax=Streptomyces antimycoticus TaxID=68175 RepID=A0A499UJH8_9ACTN|nr:hypothetical protein [Streptomyces antimycoticus]BBJ37381.1 hypothetical protein SSPO_000990 [Streptomyces antimycoticus]